MHFLLLGGVLYFFYESRVENTNIEEKVITFTPNEVHKIKMDFKKVWHDTPTEIELQALMNVRYYKHILLQEAFAVGLEKEDPAVMERMIRQMQFIMTNSVALAEPTEEQLHAYYMKNIADYSRKKSISFFYLFVPKIDKKKAEEILQLLTLNEIRTEYRNIKTELNIGQDNVKKKFGNYFALKIFQLKKGKWYMPLHSQEGQYFVYVFDMNVSKPYPFDEVEDRVYADYLSERKQNALMQAYEKFSSQYRSERL